MRMTVVAPEVRPAHAGPAGVAAWLVAGLSARGHRVDVVSDTLRAADDLGQLVGRDLVIGVGVGSDDVASTLERAAGRVATVIHLTGDDVSRLGEGRTAGRLRPHRLVTHSPAVADVVGLRLRRPVHLASPGGPAQATATGEDVGRPTDRYVVWARSAPSPLDGAVLRWAAVIRARLVVAGSDEGLPADPGRRLVPGARETRLDSLLPGALGLVAGDGDDGDLVVTAMAAATPVLAPAGSDAAHEVHSADAGWVLTTGADLDGLVEPFVSGSARSRGGQGAVFVRLCRSWDDVAARYERWTVEPVS